MLFGAFIGVMVTTLVAYYHHKQQPQVYVPEPVLSKCDSLHFANDSLVQRNAMLEDRLLTFRLGLAQLKMVNKEAHDYLINSGNFKFTERW
jgi:hypothetical protein